MAADMIKRYPAVAGAAFLVEATPRRESNIDKKEGEIIKIDKKENRKSDRVLKPHKQQKEV